MTKQWGAPLTGAQMKLLRAAGLKYGSHSQTVTWGGVWHGFHIASNTELPDNAEYRLPANHPAYTLLEAGWLDGRNVRLHYGGDRAPDDWDGEKVLCDAGFGEAFPPNLDWVHGEDGIVPIIAYIAKDDVMESDDPGTVTIAKMTEEEAREWVRTNTFGLSYSDAVNCLSCLGLIKPEPTREERFWALHEPEGTTVPTHIKKWVKDALEFEQ